MSCSIDLAKISHLTALQHAISTVCECWFCTIKSVGFCWMMSASVSNLYRQWVLLSYHQICLILLSNIHFSVRPLREVSIDFLPPNLSDFAEWHLLLCQSLQRVSVDFAKPHLLWWLIFIGSECWFCATKSVVAEQHLCWCLNPTGSECWFCATKSVLFC